MAQGNLRGGWKRSRTRIVMITQRNKFTRIQQSVKEKKAPGMFLGPGRNGALDHDLK